MANNIFLPVTARSRRSSFVSLSGLDRQGSRRWLVFSIAVNVLLFGLLFWNSHSRLPPASSDSGETPSVVHKVDEVLQHTEEIIRKTRVDIERMSSSLDGVKVVLEKQLNVGARKLQTGSDDATSTEKPPVMPAVTPHPGRPKYWLTIGIPTIPRKGVDYLTSTLESLLAELPGDPSDLLYGRVRVLVMNNQPGQHEVFDRLMERVKAADDPLHAKGGVYLQFVDNPGIVQDPAPANMSEPDDLHNPEDRPGREVRRQTCDLITLLEMAHPLAEYYLFMEDDFRSCMNLFRILSYAVAKLNAVPALRAWLALRVSYGMNGVLMRSQDVPAFAQYLRNHTLRLPPDLLWLEWMQGKNEAERAVGKRHLAVYKYNLLDHMGAVSSFSVRQDRPKWPGCFEPMAKAWSLNLKERFTPRCKRSDLSPCPPNDSDEEWTKHPIEWRGEGDKSPVVPRTHPGAAQARVKQAAPALKRHAEDLFAMRSKHGDGDDRKANRTLSSANQTKLDTL